MTTPVDVGGLWNGTLNTGFGQREDESLRQALNGLVTLSDPASVAKGTPRVVPAYFRMNEDDARLRVFPYILIDHMGITRDPTREHRGRVTYGAEGYAPMGIPDDANISYGEFPIPMIARYQVTTFARFQQHDMAMMVALMNSTVLHPRFGALDISPSRDAPDDRSMRRIDIEDGPSPNGARDSDGKRLFSRRWSIAMSTEFLPSEIFSIAPAETVVIDPPPAGSPFRAVTG